MTSLPSRSEVMAQLDRLMANACGPENSCAECGRKLDSDTDDIDHGLCAQCDCPHDENDHGICLDCGKDITDDIVSHAEYARDAMEDR